MTFDINGFITLEIMKDVEYDVLAYGNSFIHFYMTPHGKKFRHVPKEEWFDFMLKRQGEPSE